MKTQSAKFNTGSIPQFNSSHRNEGKCYFDSLSVISLSDKPWPSGEMPTRIDARFYGTGTANSCCLWIRSDEFYTQGSGKATGYGYHRPSEALSVAIRKAGFTLANDISGVGESAMREALLAIAKALKIKRPAIVVAHA